MKRILLSLAGAAVLCGGGASPAFATDQATLNDGVCILILADAGKKLKEKPGTYAVVMQFQGYYTARIRQSIGPKGDLAGVLAEAAKAVDAMSNDAYKSVGSACLDGIPSDDLGTVFSINEKLGANISE